MADLQTWENSVLGQKLDTDGLPADADQCSQVPLSWGKVLFPTALVSELLPQIGSNNGVKKWAGKSTKYFTWIENNHADINQLPLPGDVMVFDGLYGHTGVCKSASVSGFTLIQQNLPTGSGVHDTSYSWSLFRCLGWFRPIDQAVAAPNPAPLVAPVMSSIVGKTLHLPKFDPGNVPDTVWHVYNENGPYDRAHAIHALDPYLDDGLDYTILRDLGNGIYAIQTQMFGRVAIWTASTDATIS